MRLRKLALGAILVTALTLLTGCNPAKPPLNDFDVSVDRAKQLIDVRYKGAGSLQDCNIQLLVQFEDGTADKYPRFWSYWDSTKTVELPMERKGQKVERVELTGTAVKKTSNKGVDQTERVECYYVERLR